MRLEEEGALDRHFRGFSKFRGLINSAGRAPFSLYLLFEKRTSFHLRRRHGPETSPENANRGRPKPPATVNFSTGRADCWSLGAEKLLFTLC